MLLAVVLIAALVGFSLVAALSQRLAAAPAPPRVGPETATIQSCCDRSLC